MTATEEIKDLLDKQMKNWNDFKAENDKRLKEIEKNGAASATTVQNVETLNARMDEIGDQIKAAMRKAEELEAAVNRINLGGGASNLANSESLLKHVEIFNNITGRGEGSGRTPVTPEQYVNYRKALNTWLRKGPEKMTPDLMNAMTVGTEQSGGYWVTPAEVGPTVSKVYETSPMRSMCSVVTISTSDAVTGMVDNDEVSTGWGTERTSPTETNTAGVGKYRIETFIQWAEPQESQQLLDDAAYDVEGFLIRKVDDKLGRTENTAFIGGSGSGRPKGFLSYTINNTADSSRAWNAIQYVASGAAGDWAASNPADKLVDLVQTLKAAYRTGASFLAGKLTYAGIRKFKDSTGQYLWQPSLAADRPATLLGYPAPEAEDMPTIAANSYSLAFGNFKQAYLIVDRAGRTVLRDPYTAKPMVKFFCTKRVGGGLINGEAIKVLKFAAS